MALWVCFRNQYCEFSTQLHCTRWFRYNTRPRIKSLPEHFPIMTSNTFDAANTRVNCPAILVFVRIVVSRYSASKDFSLLCMNSYQVGFCADVWNAELCANFGKHKPNLVSMPANEATASLIPPMWSGWREMSGLMAFLSLHASCTTALLNE